jgi:hypothetical protein
MNLKLLSDVQLESQMNRLVRTERKITHLVLQHMNEIEDRKLYLDRGYDGMYSYLTRGLGYSNGSAYRRIHAAKLLKQVPSIGDKIESGSINLSQLAEVQKCFKNEIKIHSPMAIDLEIYSQKFPVGIELAEQCANLASVKNRALDIINKLEYQNSFETQKTLAAEMNLPVQSYERLKPQQDNSIRIELTLTEEQFADLETAKSLLSHVSPDGKWADVIGLLAKNFNQKKMTGKTMINKRALKIAAVS